ncbi:hypothetical protein BN14_11149 [Rhizoctonia solani AG-1 IB]|uniref:Uncharacterized protein n=1 Tax=Thanatephorus cucumeris (strain AG1-IB / isolate 7/3/14) TaxID=1108050 RepID=M5CCI0_THACB|nr:hypothetical protein BN14_11149 [Rhizoctonia solani AG-1 IB]
MGAQRPWVISWQYDDQWGENTIRLVEGDNALAMVKRVEGILEDSMRVLESHERVMSSREFKTFSIKHRNLLLKVVEVKQEVRRGQEQSLVSGAPAERESDRIVRDVARLQHQAEIYQQDVLTASRRAQVYEEETFMKRHLVDASQATGSSDPLTTWYSVVTQKPSAASEEPDSDNETLVDRQPYMAVAHIRPENPKADSDEPTDESYRQILILESKDKTVIMINPNRCYVNDDENTLNEDSLLEMSRAGEALLQATDPNNPAEGYGKVHLGLDLFLVDYVLPEKSLQRAEVLGGTYTAFDLVGHLHL